MSPTKPFQFLFFHQVAFYKTVLTDSPNAIISNLLQMNNKFYARKLIVKNTLRPALGSRDLKVLITKSALGPKSQASKVPRPRYISVSYMIPLFPARVKTLNPYLCGLFGRNCSITDFTLNGISCSSILCLSSSSVFIKFTRSRSAMDLTLNKRLRPGSVSSMHLLLSWKCRYL